jgi:DNA (cytosine-5)-methyltransferase 1
MSNLTLGSLFDGSGGFPLGGIMNGITPLWASEVEPFPIRVTTKRLPQMQHLGDICQIDGGKIPPVDVVTFGSPCQSFPSPGNAPALMASQACSTRRFAFSKKCTRRQTAVVPNLP